MKRGGTVAFIQARMRSERLPGKVLLDIAGQTMLERVVRRVQLARLIDTVVVATSISPADDQLAASAELLGVDVVRGSEDDVLARFGDAARQFQPDLCVRVSADSPFVDPAVCDLVLRRFLDAEPAIDYASNKVVPTYPLGLDVEVFSPDALRRAELEALEPFERAHVTVHMYRNPDRYGILAVTNERDLHTWRWTVDTPEDLAFARAVFEKLGPGNDFSWRDVVALIEREPGLAEINSHIVPKAILEG